MNFVAVLGAFATILSAGFGAMRLIGMRQRQPNFETQFAFSWILGTGIVSLLVWIFGFLIRGALLPGIVAIVCLALPLLAWKISPDPLLSLPSLRRPNKSASRTDSSR